MDYTKLRDLLKAGEWREAEDELRAKLIEAAGVSAVDLGASQLCNRSLMRAGLPDGRRLLSRRR